MMTKHELHDWMGFETASGNLNGVRIVIDCASAQEVELVSNAIESITGKGFDARGADDVWWRWLWLKPSRFHESLNAYSSLHDEQDVCRALPNATIISACDALGFIQNAAEPLSVDDLL